MKRKTISLLFIAILFINIPLLGILPLKTSAFRITSWDQIIDHKDVEGFVFKLEFHSWWNRTYLEWNEFIMGDMIDFCTITILRRNPNDLIIAPIEIIINSPSNIQYKTNFTQGAGVNFFYTGKFTQLSEEVVVDLNESGIWSINILFNKSYPIKWIYTSSEEFQNSSEFNVFYGSLVNVYTNLEYQQLKAAKALEESAKVSKESSEQSKQSTTALFIAAIVAIIHIVILIIIEYFHYRKGGIKVEVGQESKTGGNTRGDNKMISDKLDEIHENIITSLKMNQPIIVLISLSIVIAGLSQFIKLNISIASIGAAICFFIALVTSIIKSMTKTKNLYIMTFFLAGLISGFGFLLGIIFVIIIMVWTAFIAINLILLLGLASALSIISYTSFTFYDSLKKARNNVSNKKYNFSIITLILLILGTLTYIFGHVSLIYSLTFNISYTDLFLYPIFGGWIIILFGGIFYYIANKIN